MKKDTSEKKAYDRSIAIKIIKNHFIARRKNIMLIITYYSHYIIQDKIIPNTFFCCFSTPYIPSNSRELSIKKKQKNA